MYYSRGSNPVLITRNLTGEQIRQFGQSVTVARGFRSAKTPQHLIFETGQRSNYLLAQLRAIVLPKWDHGLPRNDTSPVLGSLPRPQYRVYGDLRMLTTVVGIWLIMIPDFVAFLVWSGMARLPLALLSTMH